ncbi:MAG: hypothetical protein A2Y75_12145 [Candidatus Solincola sediminis]|uniref:Uncharacterized protein n=1 Tax=Candidatus Solincola sediminis TaxID=1797199 RepID=A0A1F2WM90_9ACTN|nr:MAG: hypothetical protein A2Y75_12145 [Candidatus Solincola sediminis]
MEESDRSNFNFPPHCSILDDSSRLEQGWREALISSGDHLKRVLDEYGELDFDCLLEEVEVSTVNGCTECFKVGEPIYRVYVRPRTQLNR